MIRASVLALALIVPSPIARANVSLLVVIQPDSIVEVICFAKNGDEYAGTAFRIGEQFGVSVNHVTSAPGACYVNGKPIDIAYKSRTSDYSELTLDDGPYLPIDCGGFLKGRKYLAIGFARGISPATVLEETATGETDRGMAVLAGMVPVIFGMSGGVFLDEETGKAVGIIDATNFEEGLSWAVPLADEPVCKGRVA